MTKKPQAGKSPFPAKRSPIAGAVLLALAQSQAFAALPQGGQFQTGAGSIGYAGNAVTVSVTAAPVSGGANVGVVNWQSFNVGAGNSANFANNIPGSSQLNLVNIDRQGAASQIHGAINGSGPGMNIILVNPNGVTVGDGAQISTTGAFMAVAGDVSPSSAQDGAAGAVTIALNNAPVVFSSKAQASGAGMIKAGPSEALRLVAAGPEASAPSVVGSSDLRLEGESQWNMEGGAMIGEAQRVIADGALRIGGSLIAGSAAVDISAASVVIEGSRIEARDAGSKVRIGGGFAGADAGIPNAQNVSIDKDSAILAGKGAEIAIWSDGTTSFAGLIEAPLAKAEVSGKESLLYSGFANLKDPETGKFGDLLLDPATVTVRSSGTASIGDVSPGGAGGAISGATLSAALGGASVTLQGTSLVSIGDHINGGGGNLTIQGGAVDFRPATITDPSLIQLNGGSLIITGTTLRMAGTVVDTGGGDFRATMTSTVTLDSEIAALLWGFTSSLLDKSIHINAGGGDIDISGRSAIINSAVLDAGAGRVGVATTAGSLGFSYNGASSLSTIIDNEVRGGAGVSLSAVGGDLRAKQTHVESQAAAGRAGDISISSTGLMLLTLGSTVRSVALDGADGAGDIALSSGGAMTINNSAIWASGYDAGMNLLGSGAISISSGGTLSAQSSQISNVGEWAAGGVVGDAIKAPISISAPSFSITRASTFSDYWADGVLYPQATPPAGRTIPQSDRFWRVHGSGDVSLTATAGPGSSTASGVFSHGNLSAAVVGSLSGTYFWADGRLDASQTNSASGGGLSFVSSRGAGGLIQAQGAATASTLSNLQGGDFRIVSTGSQVSINGYSSADPAGSIEIDAATNASLAGAGGTFSLLARGGSGSVTFGNGEGGSAVSSGAMAGALSNSSGAYLFESQGGDVAFSGESAAGPDVSLRAAAGNVSISGAETRVGDLTVDAINASILTAAKFRADGDVIVRASNDATLTDFSILGNLTVEAGNIATVTGLTSLWDYGWLPLDQAGIRGDGVFNSVGGDAAISAANTAVLKDLIVAGSLGASSANGDIQALESSALGIGVRVGESKSHLNLHAAGTTDSLGNATLTALNGTVRYGDSGAGLYGSLQATGDISIRAKDYDATYGWDYAASSETNGLGGALLIDVSGDIVNMNAQADRSVTARAGGTATIQYAYAGEGWDHYDPSAAVSVEANEIVVAPGGMAESEGTLAFRSRNSIVIGQVGDAANATNVRGWLGVDLTVDDKNTNTGAYDTSSVLANHGTVLTGASWDTGFAQPAVEDSIANIRLQLAAPTPAASWIIDPVVQSPLPADNDPSVAHPGYNWEAWAAPAAKVFAVPTADNILGNLAPVEDAATKAYGSPAYYNALVGRTNYNLPGDIVSPDMYLPGVWVLAPTIGVDILAADYSMLYGDAVPSLSWSCGALDCASLSFSGSLSTLATSSSDAGIYSIGQGSLSLSSPGYHIESFTAGTLTIAPRPLDIAALGAWKIYGQSDPALAYAIAGLVNGDTAAGVLSGSLSRAAGENVGSYAIGQGSLASNGNYTINFTGASLTIDPALLSIVANGASKTYGQADPSLTYSASGLVGSDAISGSLSRDAGENAGSYAIGQGSLDAGSNYTINFTGASLTIDPALLSIVANGASKTYGQADPSLTYSASGLANGDTAESVLSGSLSRDAGENVGSYEIRQGTLVSNGNYVVGFVGEAFQIDPASLLIVANGASKTYGQADPSLTYSASGLANGDTAESVLSGSLSRDAGENVGSYEIRQGTLVSNGNYVVGFVGEAFQIDPASLLIVANGASKTYGQADPSLTYSASGLVGSDAISGSLSRDAGENAGSYAIGQGSLDAGSNYTINFTGASLTIDPALLSIVANGASKTYGQADPSLTYSASGLVGSDAISGSLSRDAGENAGSYAIGQGSLDAGSNYTINFTGADFTIDPALLTVIANPIEKIFGESDPALTYSASGLVGSDAISGSLSRDAGETVGSYAIWQGSLDAGSNYTINFTGADFTIDPALLTVIANPIEKIFGESDPALTYSASGLVGSDAISGSLSRDAGETVGSYAIWQGSLDAGSNYTINFTGADFTIGEAPKPAFDPALAPASLNPITVETSAEEESPILRTSVLIIPRDSASGQMALDVAGPSLVIGEPKPAAPAAEPAEAFPVADEAPIPAAALDLPRKIVLRGVNFDNDKATLRPESFAILDEAAERLLEWGSVAVEVVGHTDWNNTDAYNLSLSKRRAETVRNYLIGKGVSAERLSAKGYGERQPAADNQTADGRFLNRRVELIPRQ